jgi:hypothetical protein
MTRTQAGEVAVNSTLLAKVMYETGQSTLPLEFCNGAIYRYLAVPADIYHGLLSAASKGTYFNRQIRNRFAYVLLKSPQ